ncbi:hypothetical protein KKE92_01635 [Candidatus Micrarchaeota archaeon]|nr:hypothetical protein [Candidatus Micrarchaeota archaeon]
MADGIVGTISCWGYGYSVKMLVNGKDIGLSGGKSEGKRIFGTDHPMYDEAPPEMREKFFVLKNGANEISLEFSKTSANERDYLQISMELEGFPAPVFLLHSRTKASSKIKSSIQIPSEGEFMPVFVSDAGENKLVFIHVQSMNCNVTPILNGKEGMSLNGTPGQVVLENVKTGKNELVIQYQTQERLKIALITPEWVKYLETADGSEKTETFTFNSK